ncbi:hypothetical protein HDU92_006502 [Lobulomyces angularis]|nr:hypothetical protein HDU92_006502 [Lobulomyces angularis]
MQISPELENCLKEEEELLNIDKEFEKELEKLLLKINKKKLKHLEKRNSIVEKTKGFWSKSLLNHPELSKLITGEEKSLIEQLEKVKVERSQENCKSYKVILSFKKDNGFFNGTQIYKEIVDLGDDHARLLVKIGPIDWKEGKQLIKKPHVHGENCSHDHEGREKGSDNVEHKEKKRKFEEADEEENLEDLEEDDFEELMRAQGPPPFFEWFLSEDLPEDEESMFSKDFYESATKSYLGLLEVEDEFAEDDGDDE